MKKLFAICLFFLPLYSMAQIEVRKGLMAYYTFETSTPSDMSGRGHDGTDKGSPKSVKGIKGKAYHFNGSGDYVSVANQTDLNVGVGGSVSVCAWFKTDSLDVDRSIPRVIVGKRISASSNSDYIIFTSGGKLCFGTGNASDTVVWMMTNEPSLNKWHHVVGTMEYNKTDKYYYKSIYIDGVEVKTGRTKTKCDSVTTDLRIGEAAIGTGTAYFYGSIDEVRIYKRALSDTEVKAIYTFSGLDDAGIANPSGNSVICAAGKMPISISIKNFSEDSLYSCNIHCTINGAALPAISWTGALAQDSIAKNIFIDSFDFKTGTTYSIKIWTTKPDNRVDNNPLNDTNSYTIKAVSVKADAGKDKSLCFGELDTIGSSPAISGDLYSWISIPSGLVSSQASLKVLPILTTTYILTVKDSTATCLSKDSVIVNVNPLPDAHWKDSFSNNKFSFFPRDTSLFTYLWDFGDSMSSSLKKPVHNYKNTAIYKVTLVVENSFHCKAEYDSSLSFTGIEVHSGELLNIRSFPNPANQNIYIYGLPQSNVSKYIRVINLSGQMVVSCFLKSSGSNYTADINALNSGTYIACIYIGDKLISQIKFEKE